MPDLLTTPACKTLSSSPIKYWAAFLSLHARQTARSSDARRVGLGASRSGLWRRAGNRLRRAPPARGFDVGGVFIREPRRRVVRPQAAQVGNQRVQIGAGVVFLVGGDLFGHLLAHIGNGEACHHFARGVAAVPLRADGQHGLHAGIGGGDAVSGYAAVAESEQVKLAHPDGFNNLPCVVGGLGVSQRHIAARGASVSARVDGKGAEMRLQAGQQRGEVLRRTESAMQQDNGGRVGFAAKLVGQFGVLVMQGCGHGVAPVCRRNGAVWRGESRLCQ